MARCCWCGARQNHDLVSTPAGEYSIELDQSMPTLYRIGLSADFYAQFFVEGTVLLSAVLTQMPERRIKTVFRHFIFLS